MFKLPDGQSYEDDPDAISKLIIYYSEGIGTPKSEELATYWKEYQEILLKPAEPAAQPIDSAAVSPKKRMEFFAGYSYSIESPYGITVGGMGQRFGWYVRFKTNMSFMNYTDECNNQGQIIKFSNSEGESYELNTGKSSKTNSIAGTAGLIVKCFPCYMPPLVWDMVKELYYIRSRPIPMKTTTVHERYGAGILIPHTKGSLPR